MVSVTGIFPSLAINSKQKNDEQDSYGLDFRYHYLTYWNLILFLASIIIL